MDCQKAQWSYPFKTNSGVEKISQENLHGKLKIFVPRMVFGVVNYKRPGDITKNHLVISKLT